MGRWIQKLPLVCWLVAAALAGQGPAHFWELRVLDLEGSWVRPFGGRPEEVLLFLFVRTDCPISNRYAPEVKRLHTLFSPRGVTFWMVYPEKDEPVTEVRKHLEDYGFPGGVLRDPHHDLAKLAGVTITPEAAVFSPQGELLYRGRIDDRYVDFGKARAAPTRRDLAEALEAILGGDPPSHPRTQAVGCYLSDLR